MNYEVEFKFKVDTEIWKKIESKLPSNREIIITDETDMYYDNEDLFKLALQDKAIRIRKTKVHDNSSKSFSTEITYKGPKLNIKSKTRKELNLAIDDYKGFELLFQELNLKPIMEVTKLRMTHIFKIDNDIELKISLDKVRNFGQYVELESFADNIEATSFIETKITEFWDQLLKISGVSDEKARISIKESYLEIIKKEKS